MSKIIEKTLEEYPKSYVDENISSREGYTKGYNQAMQDFMEKTCEWLKDNSKKYVVCYEDGYSHYAYNSMINDLKNYMEDAEI